MLKHLETRGPLQRRWPRLLLFGRPESRLCLAAQTRRVRKRYLLVAMLVGIVMIAFDPCAYADLYVGSRDSNSVLRYNEVTGAFIDEFISSGSGGLSSPRGLILGRDGNLYVSSFTNDSVLRYDGATGDPLPAPAQTGATFVPTGSGGLQGPAGLILGRDGNLYIVSQANNSVLRYSDTTGDFLDAFVRPGSGGLSFPTGLVFGPEGNLYVSSVALSAFRYDGTTGGPLPASGQTGAVFASGPFSRGLVFGPDGNLYVADVPDNSVVRFHGATGEFMDTFVSPGSGGLNNPTFLLFGPDNNLYVCSANTNSVLRYDGTTGAFIDAFIPPGSGGLNYPSRLFFTNTDPTTLAFGRGPANHFLITATATSVSGTPFDLTVSALGPNGNIDTNYQGTVTFSTTDPDSGMVLPANYTFTTGSDNGVHTFPDGVTLVTVGDQTLTVTDTMSGITGSLTITVAPGP